jgi:large conductance mechanosensitive channel
MMAGCCLEFRNTTRWNMASNDPILEGVGLTHLGSSKALLGKHEGPFITEFRDFALRGNMVDMAVGIIIGAAFGRVVSSLVSDILMPPIGLLTGRSDFSTHFLNLSGKAYATLAEAKAAGAVTINYGIFLNAVSDFLIVALAVFMLIRQVNRLKNASAASPTKECPHCCSAIAVRATRCPNCTSAIAIA